MAIKLFKAEIHERQTHGMMKTSTSGVKTSDGIKISSYYKGEKVQELIVPEGTDVEIINGGQMEIIDLLDAFLRYSYGGQIQKEEIPIYIKKNISESVKANPLLTAIYFYKNGNLLIRKYIKVGMEKNFYYIPNVNMMPSGEYFQIWFCLSEVNYIDDIIDILVKSDYSPSESDLTMIENLKQKSVDEILHYWDFKKSPLNLNAC